MNGNSNYQIYSTSKEAWDAMYQAILGAEKSIYWELYIFVDDEAGKPFFDVLEQKARAGLDVKLIVDAMGSFWLSKERIKSLKDAGVDIKIFQERKNRYRGWWRRLWSRTHRKILVIDENIGFIGGVNIAQEMQDWLDIQVRLEGKVVHSLLRAFAKSYIICGGDKKQVRHLLKYKFRILHDEAELVLDEPHEKVSVTQRRHIEALTKARERVILFSPYYFPGAKFLYALWRAKKRGVRVDLLVPFRSDIRILTYVTYAWFALLENKYNVKIHLTKNMMHAKGVVVDDDWAMVGSSNLESTGFYDNYEVNIRFKNRQFVEKLKIKLEEWIKNAAEFDEEKWQKRSRIQRIKEWIALKLYKLWHGDH
jgi:cardiolipin synthase